MVEDRLVKYHLHLDEVQIQSQLRGENLFEERQQGLSWALMMG